jgi:hypothetical protein
MGNAESEFKWAEERPIYYMPADKWHAGQVLVSKEVVESRMTADRSTHRIVEDDGLFGYDGVQHPIDDTEYTVLYSFFKTK